MSFFYREWKSIIGRGGGEIRKQKLFFPTGRILFLLWLYFPFFWHWSPGLLLMAIFLLLGLVSTYFLSFSRLGCYCSHVPVVRLSSIVPNWRENKLNGTKDQKKWSLEKSSTRFIYIRAMSSSLRGICTLLAELKRELAASYMIGRPLLFLCPRLFFLFFFFLFSVFFFPPFHLGDYITVDCRGKGPRWLCMCGYTLQ